MLKQKISLVFITVALILCLGTGITFAQTSGTGTSLCSGDSVSQLFCGGKSLSEILNALFQFTIALGGILAILRIAYGGWLYMGSADMWSNKQHAKDVFRDAIIGLLLLLAVYLILFQINPCILQLGLLQGNNPSTCSPSQAYTSN
jgi:hypothetical protein